MIVRHLIFAFGAVLALASALLAATIRPQPRALELNLVKDRAICPIQVVVDYDPNRIPQRIKLLKCARDPLARCLAANVSRAHCCDWREDSYVANCVEIIDYVAVRFHSKGGGEVQEAYAVPVGCTCMAMPTTGAVED